MLIAAVSLLTVKRIDNNLGSGSTVTLSAGASTIDGSSTYGGLASQYSAVTLMSIGAAWYIVGSYLTS